MAAKMVQAFLRDVTGEMDVSGMTVQPMGGGQVLIVRPDGQDLMYSRHEKRT